VVQNFKASPSSARVRGLCRGNGRLLNSRAR
jgi:hypothetical protein